MREKRKIVLCWLLVLGLLVGVRPTAAAQEENSEVWYRDGMQYVLSNDLVSGYDGGAFDPDEQALRVTLIQLLWNLEGQPEVSDAPTSYTDVSGTAWYTRAVNWGTAAGIAEGYGDGRFGPQNNLTREQLVTVLYRYAKYKGVDVSVGEDTNILSYDDAFEVSTWAMGAMQWACGAGLVNGRTKSTLNPCETASCAELATVLMRYCGSLAQAEGQAMYFGTQTGAADYDKAAAAFQDAADAGMADAWYYLGRIAYQRSDYGSAAAFFETGVEQGSELARFHLGFLYAQGEGVDADAEKAKALFQEAVDHGCIEANCGLGDMYQNGYGVEADGARALECFLRAAEASDPEWSVYACLSIYEVYAADPEGAGLDSEQADFWRTKGLEGETALAEVGHPKAGFYLGYLYYSGRSVEQDYAEAMKWFLKASEVGDARSMYYIGYMYSKGLGVLENQEESMQWYLKSAESGYPTSMYNVARRYELGNGVEQNLEKAIEWYQKAADAGNEKAAQRLAELTGN